MSTKTTDDYDVTLGVLIGLCVFVLLALVIFGWRATADLGPEPTTDQMPMWTTYDGETYMNCIPGLRHSPYEDGVVCDSTDGHDWEHPADKEPHVIIDGVYMPCKPITQMATVYLYGKPMNQVERRALACLPEK